LPSTAATIVFGDSITVGAAKAAVPILEQLLPTLSSTHRIEVTYQDQHLVLRLTLSGAKTDSGFDAETRKALTELLQPDFTGHATAHASLVVDDQGPAILLRLTQPASGSTWTIDPDAVLNTRDVGDALERLAAAAASRLGLILDGELVIKETPVILTAQ
jgi:hypothetical protein